MVRIPILELTDQDNQATHDRAQLGREGYGATCPAWLRRVKMAEVHGNRTHPGRF